VPDTVAALLLWASRRVTGALTDPSLGIAAVFDCGSDDTLSPVDGICSRCCLTPAWCAGSNLRPVFTQAKAMRNSLPMHAVTALLWVSPPTEDLPECLHNARRRVSDTRPRFRHIAPARPPGASCALRGACWRVSWQERAPVSRATAARDPDHSPDVRLRRRAADVTEITPWSAGRCHISSREGAGGPERPGPERARC
jgi:hypothetical protein